jgi:glycerol-3-phosphate dehydrogenase
VNTVGAPLPTDRAALWARLATPRRYDLAIVGGGASGLGVALDAALRGYSVVLLEAHDFASGTSSRATKLAHGGVRYLAQGDIHLVREALHERKHMLQSAPHLAQPLAFVMPSYKLWETPFYGIGLKLYDALAGREALGRTEWLGAGAVQRLLPGVQPRGLKGGVKYWDGQFDDARLALALARTAALHGALVLNYCEVRQVLHEGGKTAGLVAVDTETDRTVTVRADCIVNAAGVWVDRLRALDAEAAGDRPRPIVAPSQGAHLVVDADFLPGRDALLVPSTHDGRVLFAVPWLGKVILGTTDTPRSDAPMEPRPGANEIDFILGEAGRYLSRAPTRADNRSCWAGLRPLVKLSGDHETKSISREHTVRVARSGMVTVAGGKWTTYRAMAEDVLTHCVHSGRLPERGPCKTMGFALVGAHGGAWVDEKHPLSEPQGPHSYGTEAALLETLPGAGHWLADGFSEAMVRFAVRFEYARTVADVLARRSRLLFLDAAHAARLAPSVADLLRQEGLREPALDAFVRLAREYATPAAQSGA